MFRDDSALELRIAHPQKSKLIAELRENMRITLKLFQESNAGDGAITDQEQTV